jgi:purine nucleosidase
MRVILGTDPSMGSPGPEIDDGFAIALMVADDVFQFDLVTSVNGNISTGPWSSARSSVPAPV